MNVLKYTILIVMLWLAGFGCSGDVATGVAIGLGTSEAQKLAEESKATLIAEVMRLREALDSAQGAEEKMLIAAQLEKIEKQLAMAETTTAAVTEAMKALAMDWEDWSTPEAAGNKANYIITVLAALGIFGGGVAAGDKLKKKPKE
jgi:hypothetical protein